MDRRSFLAACSGLASFAMAGRAGEPSGAELQEVIDKLGSRDFHEREAATRTLVKLQAALPALRRAAKHHDDATVRRAANALVKTLETLRILTGHTGPVWALAFTPDSRFLASAGNDGPIRIWDLRAGKTIRTLQKSDLTTALAFSPDAKLLAAAGERVKLWDIANERVRFDLGQRRWTFAGAAFSPDATLLVAGGRGKTADVWRAGTGKRQRTFSGHKAQVNCVAFAPDGRHLATGSHDETIRIWDVTTGRQQVVLSDHGPVQSAVFSSDGRALYSSTFNGDITRWDWSSGRKRWHVTCEDTVFSVALRRGDQLLASACADGAVQLWEARTGKERRKVFYSSMALAVAFSPDGKSLTVAGGHIIDGGALNEVAVWDTDFLLSQSGQ